MAEVLILTFAGGVTLKATLKTEINKIAITEKIVDFIGF
jgi:hypothetical protein